MARPAYSLSQPRPQTLLVTALAGAALTSFADKTGFIQFVMPEHGRIVGITLNVNQRGGTHVTSEVDVLAGASSLLAAAFDVAALTPGTPVSKEGSALSSAAASVAKDSVVKVSTNEASGTSPTWADVTLQIDYVPLGD